MKGGEIMKGLDVYSVSLYLRIVSYVLHYAEYIQSVTDDADFFGGLVAVTSDYLYYLSDECFKTMGDSELVQRHSEKAEELEENVTSL